MNPACPGNNWPVSTRIPVSTYRLQFNSGFTFEQAAGLVDYLHELGISDCYASPLALARPGSIHGYDVTDHSIFNPEIGGEPQFLIFAQRLKSRGMGILLDTVPNHMCIADPSNRWWFDILENGPSSPFAGFFDIDWNPPKADLANKVLLPVLGDQYGRVLENQEISVSYQEGAFAAHYFDLVLPLAPRTWIHILEPAHEDLVKRLGESHPDVLELESIVTALGHLPLRTETDPARVRERQREKEIIKGRLSTLVDGSGEVNAALGASLKEINGIKGDPRSFDRLEKLLAEQAYRLSFWHVAADEINYRRFFDVNDLAAIRVEDPAVFAPVHELTFRLIREGFVTGLRIDHVDGLLDPGQYLQTLQRGCIGADDQASEEVQPFYVVVEKILSAEEPLHADWPVYGSTGYEFLNTLNGLFVDSDSRAKFVDLYARFTGWQGDFRDIVYDSKKLVLRASMSGEQNVLTRKLDRISEQHRWSRDFTLNSLGRVLAEVIACFPVYRSYVTSIGSVRDEDRRNILLAINRAKRRNAALSESTFDFLASVLLLEHPDGLDEASVSERLEFTLRFQQLTSPVMAKGFEDTALYRYYPLASLNEVGGDPTSFGMRVESFHARNLERLRKWPHGLSATSTHDTKRGEDVRARINVLSEIPGTWERAVWRWHQLNAAARQEMEGAEVPDPNEEYLFYQTLVGAWPLLPMTPEEHEQYVKRIQGYMHKAANEAKLKTSWINPDHNHDRALAEFVGLVLRPGPENRFLVDFTSFQMPIAQAGILNSLSQTVIKIGAPGVPDFYQGTELWDLNLVDPDNRRPVDYSARRTMLAEIHREAGKDPLALTEKLLGEPGNGAIKMFVTNRALEFRSANRELFAGGAYFGLEAAGERRRNVIAFARSLGDRQVIVAAARFFMALGRLPESAIGNRTWADTFISAPENFLHGRYVDLFTGQTVHAALDRDARQLAAAEVFAHLPVAMLVPSD